MLMLMAVFAPVFGGVVLYLLRPVSRWSRTSVVLFFSLLTAWIVLSAIGDGGETLTLLRLSSELSLSFRVDGLSSLFAGMVVLLWPVACLYASEYMAHEGGQTRFFSFYLASLGATLGVAFSANILTLYLFYELLTLMTLPLVMHDMDGKARYAGKVYLMYSMSGAALAFVAMVVLMSYGSGEFQLGGSVFGDVSEGGLMLRFAYILGFFGFGVKAAVMPGHLWLLRASVAPTPVTALLHAVAVVKAGVFSIARLTWYGVGVPHLEGTWAQSVVMTAALLTIVIGSAKALGTQHLKRRLAWSTVSNLSYVLLGITAMTAAGLVAGMTHMVFHAVIKITLFFCVGAIHHKMNKDTLEDIEAMGYVMPIVFTCFAVASLGLMGIPPLAGFNSKWMLAKSLIGTGHRLSYLAVGGLIISALFTALYLMQIVLLAFFPRQNRRITRRVSQKARRDPGWCMTVSLVILVTALLLLSVMSNAFTEWLAQMILAQ